MSEVNQKERCVAPPTITAFERSHVRWQKRRQTQHSKFRKGVITMTTYTSLKDIRITKSLLGYGIIAGPELR
jgi:hypothetical protein